MEKYCTIAIFLWLGLPLFVRGLIILESDESLNNGNKDRITADFQNHDDHRVHSLAHLTKGDDDGSVKTKSQNTDDKSNDKGDEIASPGFESHDDYYDYPSEDYEKSYVDTRPHNLAYLTKDFDDETINPESLDIDDKSNDKIVSLGYENHDDYHGFSSENPISADVHKSIKDDSPSNDHKSNGKDDEIVSLGFENDHYYGNHPLENLFSGGDYEMVQSDPVMEEIPKDIELIYQMNKRRHTPDRGLSAETKKLMLDLHNVYRGNVTPPAADMNFLEWDESLEELAQLWADNCVFAHGRPPNTHYYFDGKIKPYGQNLYIGTDPSGYKGLWMWYEEYMHYELRNQTCKPNEQCGHYVQMAWAESKRLGCGMKLCGMRYLIVCHYYPGAIKDVQMFRVGRPCSLCEEEDGALCKNKLCMPHELCKRRPELCESATCNLKCHNCGRLNKTACQCTCADGWDSRDCSKPCADAHERCGRKPGFPHKASCSIQNYSVAKKYCRKMCDTCVTVTNDTTVNHLCCEGRLCEKGYVLDLERKPCRCTLLCPGPLCDVLEEYSEDESSALKYNFIYLISHILVFYFINYSNNAL